MQSALEYAKRNLDTPLTVRRLAEAAHLSPRQFSRAFSAETGQSPAKAVENVRIASVAGDLRFSELTIARLLGHSPRGVTQGYVHLDTALVVGCGRGVCENRPNARRC